MAILSQMTTRTWSGFLETYRDNINPKELQIRKPSKMLVSLTVGKVDAGMAVLLTDDKRIVSRQLFPPPG
jgi:hypothetical protein